MPLQIFLAIFPVAGILSVWSLDWSLTGRGWLPCSSEGLVATAIEGWAYWIGLLSGHYVKSFDMGMSEICTFILFWCKVYKLVCPFAKVIFMLLNQMYFMLPEMYFVFFYNLHYWLQDAVYVTALGPPSLHPSIKFYLFTAHSVL